MSFAINVNIFSSNAIVDNIVRKLLPFKL
uniref:Uncharacterized protein n=1 Tax=Tetranychus urticae TaxID=32264 RepID=T1KQ21_TETUR